MFASHRYDKGTVSKIYELLKRNKKKTTTQLRKDKQKIYLVLMAKYILYVLCHNLYIHHNLVV